MTPELVITRGLPASGKTTWARAWVAEQPGWRARCNRDDLRHNLYGVYWGLDRHQEETVTNVQRAAVRALLDGRMGVVVDDTHLRLAHARAWSELAQEAGVPFTVRDFKTDVGECVDRDLLRRENGERAVGDDVIYRLADRYGLHNGRWLPDVPAAEPPDSYVPNWALPRCWLVDIDGTLAHMEGRGPFEWHRVGEDHVHPEIRDLVVALDEISRVVIVSGRDEVCRSQTEEWLIDNNVPWDALFMRPEGDTRDDRIVKSEILFRDVAPRWNVVGVLDDRDKVVRMWRQLGIRCLQVAPGAF